MLRMLLKLPLAGLVVYCVVLEVRAVKSKRNRIRSNRNRNRNHAIEFGFGLAENRNLIFGFVLGYAEIGCLAEISAETEI